MDQITARVAPKLHARLGGVLVPYGRAFTAVRYGAASSHAADTAKRKIVAAIDRLEAELGEHDYLVGDRFTVADLTAAALLYPIVRPSEGPLVTERMPEPFERFRDTLRGRPGYRWVEHIFHRHRHTRPPSPPAADQQPATRSVHTAR
jgi:glutathione S-transferase